jgi:2,4-dienoyl-CoA reductase (NADPH2)
VVLLQRSEGKLGAGLGKTTGWIHRATLAMRGVEMIGGVTYERIDHQGLHVRCGGDARVLDVDHVVICAGQESVDELVAELEGAKAKVHVIGGAKKAGEIDAKRAIDEGTRAALSF